MPILISADPKIEAWPYGFIGSDGRPMPAKAGLFARKKKRDSVRAAIIDKSWSDERDIKHALKLYLAVLTFDKMQTASKRHFVLSNELFRGIRLKMVRRPPAGRPKSLHHPVAYYERYFYADRDIYDHPSITGVPSASEYSRRGDYTYIEGEWWHGDQL